MIKFLHNKTLVGWVVGITIAGTVLAYVPLLFVPPAEAPPAPQNNQPLVQEPAPSIIVTSTPSSTEERAPRPFDLLIEHGATGGTTPESGQ